MQVKLRSPGGHAPWQPGEIVTLQVATVDEDGGYTCDTLDTFPADLKDRHAAEIAQIHAIHQEHLETQAAAHMRETEALLGQLARRQPQQ